MSRRRVEGWEQECRSVTERIRVQLAALANAERLATTQGADISEIGHVLDAATMETSEIVRWLPRLRALRAQDARPQAWAALSVFQAALPALLYCTDVMNWSVALISLADPSTHDVELAAEALRTAERVVTVGLRMIEDTPALKTKDHWPATKQVIDHFAVLGESVLAIGLRVSQRLKERRQELGLGVVDAG